MTIVLPVIQTVNFEDLAEEILRNAGASLHVPTGTRPTNGYMVALPDHEHTCPTWLLDGIEIQRYVLKHADLLTYAYFGAWVDDGTVYLDASVKLTTLDTAITIGKTYKQQAIYDVSNGMSIYL